MRATTPDARGWLSSLKTNKWPRIGCEKESWVTRVSKTLLGIWYSSWIETKLTFLYCLI